MTAETPAPRRAPVVISQECAEGMLDVERLTVHTSELDAAIARARRDRSAWTFAEVFEYAKALGVFADDESDDGDFEVGFYREERHGCPPLNRSYSLASALAFLDGLALAAKE